ncbi:WYL domain-containing protein [Paenibacillus sp. GCM10027626]|uniref:WYL domain-containing protein n=1 Tax=Paenibacillus sp. GCM10027626 TaxID=3273411 RepID=UPI0036311BCE
MNLFEKIFNYQIFSRLEGSQAYFLTTPERSWLKSMLNHPAAADAFLPETLAKLRTLLQEERTNEDQLDFTQHLAEKGRSIEKQVYHPLLRPLRRMILTGGSARLSFKLKNGQLRTEQPCFPYRLEYSMVKREWYLLWKHLRSRALMLTKLANITALEADNSLLAAVKPPVELAAEISSMLESRKEQVIIEVVPRYNSELSRILYAFSCFEKSIDYDAAADTYRIKLIYFGDEGKYILTKIRFLGLRVRIVENNRLRWRMLDSATKALARYNAD